MATIKVNMDSETPWGIANKLAAQWSNQQSAAEAGVRRLKEGDLDGSYDEDTTQADALARIKAQQQGNLDYLDRSNQATRERDQWLLDNGGTPGSRRYGASGQPVGELEAAKYAIKGVESGGGNYAALGPITSSGDRAYGAYQVMGANIPSWTRKYVGREMSPDEFLKDKQAQEQVFEGAFGDALAKHGNLPDAMSVWHSGVPLAQAQAEGRTDGYMKTQDYVKKAQSFLQRGVQLARGGAAAARGPSVTQQRYDDQKAEAAKTAPGATDPSNPSAVVGPDGLFATPEGDKYKYVYLTDPTKLTFSGQVKPENLAVDPTGPQAKNGALRYKWMVQRGKPADPTVVAAAQPPTAQTANGVNVPKPPQQVATLPDGADQQAVAPAPNNGYGEE